MVRHLPLLLLFLLLVLAGCTLVPPRPQQASAGEGLVTNSSSQERVYQVVDGDTLLLSSGEYVRLIGIDAPERKQEGYDESSAFLRQLVEGKSVQLKTESSIHDRDSYGRLLRHVVVNSTNVALLLLENKHATVYQPYQGEFRGEFEQAQARLS